MMRETATQHELEPSPAEELNMRFASSINKRDCRKVEALMLYWEDGDDDFEKEARSVQQVWEDVFHFPVTHYPIPSNNSYFALLATLSNLLSSLGDGPSLLIIHYGGHGDADDDKASGQECRSVWAAQPDGGPTLEWYMIQEIIAKSGSDILLLLDCCYAAQAARGRDSRNGRLEVLAAASMGTKTLMAGNRSFTNVVLKEIRKSLTRDGFVRIKDLHASLCHRQHNLFATPVHISIKSSSHSLELWPTEIKPSEDSAIESTYSSIPMLVQLREHLSSEALVQVSEWLGSGIPHVVSGLLVLEKTEHIQHAVQDVAKGHKRFVKDIETSSKGEIMEAWTTVVALVSTYAKMDSGSGAVSEAGKPEQVIRFLRDLYEKNDLVMDALERGILTCPNLDDSDIMKDAADDDVLKGIGMDQQLNLRRLITSSDYRAIESEQCQIWNDSALSTIQEIKEYGTYVDPRDQPALESRVKLLATLLAAQKADEFRSLRCLRWTHQVIANTYTLDFTIPAQYEGCQYMTLDAIVRQSKRQARPTLNERIRMSCLLAKALQKWHVVGWVHQSISSHNVLFFLNKDTRQVDFSHPFLHGFEFARPDSDPSIGRAGDDLEFNIYRHPDRQGSVRKGHLKKHDIYSLGVVLLEIGLWQRSIDLIDPKPSPTPQSIRVKLQRHCSERLSHFSGTAFKAAVDACLSLSVVEDCDDEIGSRLATSFKHNVIDELEKGVKAF
ncbi:hypothetical protein Daus18300_003250 [Diaporthe australafricana]|uniref:DUF7580 domain-containing protein n=1 Tax=Diaporthe australafricana TaxID=127596 RepID=A0ABR3XHI7_9PEZI